jgi:hypothetical protein
VVGALPKTRKCPESQKITKRSAGGSCPLSLFGWIIGGMGGLSMRRPEASPLYVWLTIGLMTIGTAVYIISYFLTEVLWRS